MSTPPTPAEQRPAAAPAEAGAAPRTGGSVVLSARGLTMRFGGFVAVDQVDLDVREGELHALVGPNGAGKSTLLNLLGGQLLQTSGEIWFMGRSLGSSTPPARARMGIGRSFQLTSVVPGFSCLENVVLAVEAQHRMLSLLRLRPRPADVAHARQLLDLVGLGAQAHTAVEALGHGQQKQLEVAIALGGRPRILLLDEPTSGLTEHERQSLGHLLQRVARHATIVMAEHDVDFVRRIATRVSAFNLGRKIAEGSAGEVFDTPEVKQVFLRGGE
ncbi:MAG TPA: ATP-binding cassette domain-containing protein [Candidatus Dormibacteraeota bacterium]|jgi:branched-chain amino acid transport system ATP-binding protein|nr:ATP-binding cassette domain-containing protein [Candidatus Dormibacteraeota bacterium]